MKRLFSTILILFFMFTAFQVFFNIFGSGHKVSYSLENNENSFLLKETYVSNDKKELNSYYIEIKKGDELFNFQITYNFYGTSRIVKEIVSFSNDNYNCILPIFNEKKILTDLICKKNKVQYMYAKLKGKDKELDEFALSLKNHNYDENQFLDNTLEVKIDNTATVYTNNIVKSHYFVTNSYRGIYTINEDNLQKMFKVDIFTKDTYKRPISAIVDKYYITADYSQNYSFDQFKMVDITNNKATELFINGKIEHSSYIQGVVENKLYLFDYYNKKQYEIRVNPHSIVEVGNSQTDIKHYELGTWTRIPISEAVSKKPKFNLYNEQEKGNWYKVEKTGGEKTGYIYYFKKVGNEYEVYRANQSNDTLLTYLFKTKNVDNMKYIDDFVYYKNDKSIKYYNDYYGERTIFQNSELTFNDSLYYNVYKK